MDKLEKYQKNKELLGFKSIVTVQNKKIKVEFKNLDQKYNKALSSLVMDICKEYIAKITEEYNKCNNEVVSELSKTKDEDIRRYISVLLNNGEKAFEILLYGTIKVARNRVFYQNIIYREDKGWMYGNQPVKL